MAGRRGPDPVARLPRGRALRATLAARPTRADVDRHAGQPPVCSSPATKPEGSSSREAGDRLDTARSLRETSDALLRDLDVLVTLEEEKRSIEPGDPRLVELAQRIDEIARRVLTRAGRQRDLTAVANAQVAAGSPAAPDTPIEGTHRSIQAILTEWRDAERRAAAATEGSADAAEAEALVDRLRSEYRAAQESARGPR